MPPDRHHSPVQALLRLAGEAIAPLRPLLAALGVVLDVVELLGAAGGPAP